MYISEIKISNFRGFRGPTKINFTEGINVIIGHNNSGKTTILKALQLLFDSENNKRLSVDDFNRSISIEELKENPPKIIISAKLIESEQEEKYSEDLVTVATWLTKIDKPYEAKITYEFSLPINEYDNYKKIMNEINSNDISDYWNEIEYNFIRKYTNKIFIGNSDYKNIAEVETLKKFDFQFLSAIRDVERDLFSGKNSLLKEVIDFFIDYDIKNDNTLDKDTKSEKIKDKKRKFSEEAANLIDILQRRMEAGKEEMLKYANKTGASFNNYKPSFDGKILDTELYSALRLIVENETGIKLPATQNGLGYNNLIYISLLLAKMQKNSSGDYLGSNAKVFSLLAIEEPEAHLHPNMQYKFLKFLNENKEKEVRQIFITSHSPNITAAVNLDDIIVLDKEDTTINVAYPGKVFSNSEEDIKSKKYVKRFIDVTKADMFFAKSLIFVEGLAEQLLIPEFAEILDYDLVDKHISVINIGGRYFKHFLKLFDTSKNKNAIKKRVACITDLDPVRKLKEGKNNNWKACLPMLLNCDTEKYDYKDASNNILSEEYKSNNIKIFTQKKGESCTLEYDIILNNPNLKMITESVKNKTELQEMMEGLNEGKNINEIIDIIREGDYKDEITKNIDKIKIDDIVKHIIAGRYLNSIKKGSVAQELAEIIGDKEINIVIPQYIREAIEWICQEQ